MKHCKRKARLTAKLSLNLGTNSTSYVTPGKSPISLHYPAIKWEFRQLHVSSPSARSIFIANTGQQKSSFIQRLRPGRTRTPSCPFAYLGLLCGDVILSGQLTSNGGSRCSFKREIIILTQTQSSPSSVHLTCWAYLEFGCKFCCSYKASKLLRVSSLFESCFKRGYFKIKVSERAHKCKCISTAKNT